MNRPDFNGSLTLTGGLANRFPAFAWNRPIQRKALATLALREPCAMATADVPRMLRDPEPIYERVVSASFEVGGEDKYGMADVAMVLWPNKYTRANSMQVIMEERVEAWRVHGLWSRRVWFEGMMRRLFSEESK